MGHGFRTTIFFTGCPIHCKGCFNSQIWDPMTGKPYTEDVQEKVLSLCAQTYCHGLSVLGGEPTAKWNIEAVCSLCEAFKQRLPNKDIWVWSGRLKEDVERLAYGPKLLSLIDALIDGPYIEELSDPFKLKWKGSSNQRFWRKCKGVWMIDEG